MAALPGSHRPLSSLPPSPPRPLSSRPPLLPIAASRLRVKPRPSSGSPVGGTAGRVAGKVQGWCHTVHRVPSALFFRAMSPGSGHKNPVNRPLRGLPGVVGRFRRVVVSRRCTQHHLRRVMVETPPRAGPSPPHGPARFFMPAFRPSGGCCPAALRRMLPRRPPADAAQPPAASRQPPAVSRQPSAVSRQPSAASRQPPAASRPARFPPAQRPTPSVPRRSSGSRPPDRRAAVTAQTACRHSTADKSASARTLGTPAPAGVRFASGDRHTGRGRPRPRPGRLPRDAAGCRACPIRTEGLTIT